jgi:hypothetical protein
MAAICISGHAPRLLELIGLNRRLPEGSRDPAAVKRCRQRAQSFDPVGDADVPLRNLLYRGAKSGKYERRIQFD